MNKRLQCAKIGSPVLCTWRVYFSSDFDEVFGNEFLKKSKYVVLIVELLLFLT
jgi:hypothetical protein